MTAPFRGIVQDSLPPYTCTCTVCGLVWQPKATTDSGLQREKDKHWAVCR